MKNLSEKNEAMFSQFASVQNISANKDLQVSAKQNAKIEKKLGDWLAKFPNIAKDYKLVVEGMTGMEGERYYDAVQVSIYGKCGENWFEFLARK